MHPQRQGRHASCAAEILGCRPGRQIQYHRQLAGCGLLNLHEGEVLLRQAQSLWRQGHSMSAMPHAQASCLHAVTCLGQRWDPSVIFMCFNRFIYNWEKHASRPRLLLAPLPSS